MLPSSVTPVSAPTTPSAPAPTTTASMAMTQAAAAAAAVAVAAQQAKMAQHQAQQLAQAKAAAAAVRAATVAAAAARPPHPGAASVLPLPLSLVPSSSTQPVERPTSSNPRLAQPPPISQQARPHHFPPTQAQHQQRAYHHPPHPHPQAPPLPPPRLPNPLPHHTKPVPSVILSDHGGVKTMIWTDGTSPGGAAAAAPTVQQMQLAANQQQHQRPRPVAPVSHHQSNPLPQGIILPSQSSITSSSSSPSSPFPLGRPPSADHARKMSSAVDGLLSLRQGGHNGTQPHQSHQPPSSAGNPYTTLAAAAAAAAAAAQQRMAGAGPLPAQPAVTTASGQSLPHQSAQRRSPINMERLWAGDRSQLPSNTLDALVSNNNLIHFFVCLTASSKPQGLRGL